MSEQGRFHRGERAVQERAGEAAIAARSGSLTGDTVIAGARAFIARQFMAVVGSTGADGRVWASALFGQPGFAHTEDGKAILLDIPLVERDDADPFWHNIVVAPGVGMLFIELGTRRRYRVNGSVVANTAHGIEVAIREAYPNCPKYIQRRQLRALGAGAGAGQMGEGTLLGGAAEAIVRQADTLFVASHHPDGGGDASHRGGAAGFITVLDPRTLRIPDYPGNSMFNTLGNFAENPGAGLCIPDFAANRMLQLTGEATLHWDVEDAAGKTGGTGRFWDFRIDEWILRTAPLRLEWEYLEPSPFNLPLAHA